MSHTGRGGGSWRCQWRRRGSKQLWHDYRTNKKWVDDLDDVARSRFDLMSPDEKNKVVLCILCDKRLKVLKLRGILPANIVAPTTMGCPPCPPVRRLQQSKNSHAIRWGSCNVLLRFSARCTSLPVWRKLGRRTKRTAVLWWHCKGGSKVCANRMLMGIRLLLCCMKQ